MAQNSASPRPTFASQDALGPCVMELCVAGISAVLEPCTTASATAAFGGLLGRTALGTPVAAAYCGSTRRRSYFCGHAGVNITHKRY